mmetsp:Transcript_25669/g.58556  ORF Transcript_25669/g.58556 Transcript_25669/m.58556 type:complete len:89 (-) Transcript_25669:795-1061(-)
MRLQKRLERKPQPNRSSKWSYCVARRKKPMFMGSITVNESPMSSAPMMPEHRYWFRWEGSLKPRQQFRRQFDVITKHYKCIKQPDWRL